MSELKIPEISDEKLNELRAKIRPAWYFAKGRDGLFPDERGFLYYLIGLLDPRTAAFYCDADPKLVPGEIADGLEPFHQIQTHHSTGGFFFKPSEEEILAQIPKELHDIVVAYTVVDYDMRNARGHGDSVATLQLYKKKT